MRVVRLNCKCKWMFPVIENYSTFHGTIHVYSQNTLKSLKYDQIWPQIGLVLTPEKWNSITRLTLIVFTSNIDPWAAMVENSVWPELFLTEGRVSRHKSLNLQYRHIHNLSNDEMFLLPGKDRKHSGNNICWSFSCFWRLLTFWKNIRGCN